MEINQRKLNEWRRKNEFQEASEGLRVMGIGTKVMNQQRAIIRTNRKTDGERIQEWRRVETLNQKQSVHVDIK
jgi:hypothetical protein